MSLPQLWEIFCCHDLIYDTLKIFPQKSHKCVFQDYGIFKKKETCDACKRDVTEIRQIENYFFFYCPDCVTKKSVRGSSILSGQQLSCRTFVLLIYVVTMLTNLTYDQSKFISQLDFTTICPRSRPIYSKFVLLSICLPCSK